MEGRVLRRSVTLADQLAAVAPAAAAAVGPAGSCNLRDLLKLRDEDELAAGRRAAAVTLASAMAAERQTSLPAPSSSSSSASSPSVAATAAAAARTLLDIIRDDQPPPPSAGDPLVRRAVSLPAPNPAASPPAATPTSAEAVAPLAPHPLPPATEAEEEEDQGERVSLMALLEQTDRHWSAGSAAREEDFSPAAAAAATAEALVDDEDEDAEPEAAGKGGVVPGSCCVCMARAKGAAFIPCGHTFCRPCARELLAGRGRCPLCNAAIVDVLDIF